MNNPCFRYDITIFQPITIKDELLKWVKEHCKKWAIQGEECPSTGNFHWQCRVSLLNKSRKPPSMTWAAHVTPTSLNCNDFYAYCTKENTRVIGPYTDKDKELYIPKQIRMITQLKPWQQSILDKSLIFDTRIIDWVFCPTGNIGKSTLCGWIRAYELGRVLPMVNDYKDLMEIVLEIPTSTLYLLDLPRAIKKNKLFQLYSSIETIKDGYAFDTRYRFREKVFDSPNIWVFSNTLPNKSLLSNDRWRIWTVSNELLIPYKRGEGLDKGVCVLD